MKSSRKKLLKGVWKRMVKDSEGFQWNFGISSYNVKENFTDRLIKSLENSIDYKFRKLSQKLRRSIRLWRFYWEVEQELSINFKDYWTSKLIT